MTPQHYDLETGNMQVRALTPELDDIPANAFGLAMTLCAVMVLPATTAESFKLGLTIFFAGGAVTAWVLLFLSHLFGKGKRLQLSPFLRLFRR